MLTLCSFPNESLDFFIYLFPSILNACKWRDCLTISVGFLVFVFGVWFLFVFLFDSVESSNIEKHFSCSLIDPLLPNCLLFHFFFVKMTQGFLICCFQKQTVLLHYPSICTSTKMTAHTTNYTDHQAGSGERNWGGQGWGIMVAYQESSLPSWSFFSSTPAWHYIKDLLTSLASLSCSCPELSKDFWSWWNLGATAFGHRVSICNALYPARICNLKPTSLTHTTEACSTGTWTRWGYYLMLGMDPFQHLTSSFDLTSGWPHLSAHLGSQNWYCSSCRTQGVVSTLASDFVSLGVPRPILSGSNPGLTWALPLPGLPRPQNRRLNHNCVWQH